MSIWIRLIGLFMFYQSGAHAPYHAIAPKWEQGDDVGHKYCDNNILQHAAYLRLPTDRGHVIDDSKWPDKKDCDQGLNCAAYPIPDGSTITIDPGFALDTSKATDTLSCFMPNLTTEGLITHPKLRADALTSLSATDFVLPAGRLFVHEFKNDNIFTALKIQVPEGVTVSQIRIIATPHSGSAADRREIVVSPTTIIDITDVPMDHAGMDYEKKLMIPGEGNKGHFFFFQKLLDHPDKCKVFPDLAPESCPPPRLRNHESGQGTTYNAGCGNITIGSYQSGGK